MIFKHDGSDFNFQTLLDGKLVLRKEDRHMATLDTIQEVKAFICGYRERAQEEAGKEQKNGDDSALTDFGLFPGNR